MSSWQAATKKKLSIKAFHVLFVLLGFVFAVLSFVFSLSLKVDGENLKASLVSPVGGLDDDLIFDLYSTQLEETESVQYTSDLYYFHDVAFDWPGSSDGCYCPGYDLRREVDDGLKSRRCSKVESASGCIQIDPTPARKLSSWKYMQKLILVKGVGTSFNSLRKKMTPEGNCPEGFLKCGNPQSLSKGVCVPAAFARCPITDILVDPVFAEATLTVDGSSDLRQFNSRIYQLKRVEGKNPLSHLSIVQDRACINRRGLSLADGRPKYALLVGDHRQCIQDPTAWYLESLGEVEFFRKNDLHVQHLVNFSTSDDFQYRIAVSSFLDWSVDCANQDPNLSGQSRELDQLRNHMRLLFILFTVSLAGWAVSTVVTVWSVVRELFRLYRIALIVCFCSFVMVAPSLIICFIGSLNFLRSMEAINKQNCAPPHLTSIYNGISEQINSGLKRSLLLSVVLFSVSFVFECASAAAFLFSHLTQLQKLGANPLPEKPEPSNELAAGNLMQDKANDSLDADKPIQEKPSLPKTHTTAKNLHSTHLDQNRPFKDLVFRRRFQRSTQKSETQLLGRQPDISSSKSPIEVDRAYAGDLLLSHSLPPLITRKPQQPEVSASIQQSASPPGSGPAIQ